MSFLNRLISTKKPRRKPPGENILGEEWGEDDMKHSLWIFRMLIWNCSSLYEGERSWHVTREEVNLSKRIHKGMLREEERELLSNSLKNKTKGQGLKMFIQQASNLRSHDWLYTRICGKI